MNDEELQREVHALFGDAQATDGGYQSLYDGEWLDMTVEASDAAVQPDAAHWHDIWNTMFWPAVLFGLARFTRILKR